MKAVNLIPAEQREGAAVGAGRSEGAAYAVLALLAGVALLAVLYGMAKHEVSSRRAQAATLSAQAQSAQSAAGQLSSYTSFVALRDQRTQAVDTLVGSRFDWAHVFHEFGRTVPAGVSFNSLQGTIGSSSSGATPTKSTSSTSAASVGVPVASATPPGSVPTFTLAGCAVSQKTVALMLERLRLIDGVAEVSLQSSTASSSATGGGSGGGGCAGHDPAFSVTITFAALPVPTAATASTSTVADSAGSSTATSTSSGSAAR
jgi:Tfp pilus assembly protein PilN